MAESPVDPLIGSKLAHFQVETRLGAGGMGVVYRALDTRLRRFVALKVLPPHVAADAERKAQLLKEARAAAAINHPNLAAVYEVDEAEGKTFIAMEWVSGRSLRQLLGHGPLPVELALAIAGQVAQALQRAHGAGLVHRDLKPENVMVADDGTVKLLDFGLAKQTGLPGPAGESATASRDGLIMGTPGYMAPEQAEGRPVDARADLFAFGVTLHEMLAGAMPFKGATPMELTIAAVRDPPTPLAEVRPDLPPELTRLVAQLLQKSPDQRPPGASAVLAALGSHTPVPPPAPVDPFAHTVPSPGTPVAAPARPSRFRWAALGLAALLALAGGLYALGRARAHPAVHALAVADVSNETGDPELDGLSGMLITALETSSRFSVLTRARMLDVLQQTPRAGAARIDETVGRAICARAGADALVVASVRRLGAVYDVDLKVLSPQSDVYLFTAHERAQSKEEIPALLDRLAERTRGALGGAPSAGQTASGHGASGDPASGGTAPEKVDVSKVTTANLEAYQAFYEAEAAFSKVRASSDIAGLQQVLPKLDRALQLDPGFVQASILKAWVQLFLRERPQAKQTLEQARTHLDRANRKDALYLEALAAQVNRDWDRASALFSQLLAEWPEEKLAWYQLGDMDFHRGEMAQSVEPFEHALALDPTLGFAYDHLVDGYANLGQPDQAVRTARAYTQHVSGAGPRFALLNALLLAGADAEAAPLLAQLDTVPNAWTALELSVRSGDPARARKELDLLGASASAEVRHDAQSYRAALELREGRAGAAIELLQALRDDPTLDATRRAKAAAKLAFAHGLKGDARAALDDVGEASASGDPFAKAWALLAAAELEPETWPDGAARVRVSDTSALYPLFSLLGASSPAEARPLVDRLMHEGDYWAFLARWQLQQGEAPQVLEHAGRCLDRALDAEWDDYVWPTLADQPGCRFWRARALEATGKRQEAIAAYQQLLDGWKQGDADLPLRVAAEERLQVLGVRRPEAQNVAR